MGAPVEGWTWEKIEKTYGLLDKFVADPRSRGVPNQPGWTEDGMERYKLMCSAIIKKAGRISIEELTYKPFYLGGQSGSVEAREEIECECGAGGELPCRNRFLTAGASGNSPPATSSALTACDFGHFWADVDPAGAWPATGDHTVALELLRGACLPRRRSAGLEWIVRLAALAFPMAQDAIDDPRLCNKGNDLHAGATGANQRVHFEDFPEQARPGASGFPGEVGIVLVRLGVCRATGAVANG
jgi:hypothetical protein